MVFKISRKLPTFQYNRVSAYNFQIPLAVTFRVRRFPDMSLNECQKLPQRGWVEPVSDWGGVGAGTVDPERTAAEHCKGL